MRRIRRLVDKIPVTLSFIKHHFNIKASKETIRQAMLNEKIEWKACQKSLKMTKKHKEERVKFARQAIINQTQWKNVLFSDEKCFGLDGPVSKAYAWSSKDKCHKLITRHSKGGHIMVWGGIKFNSKTDLCIVDGTLRSPDYKTILEQHVVENLSMSEYFQQDNSPVHSAKIIKEFLIEKNINILSWPAISPDMNIIENVWAIMCHTVYCNKKQYNDKESLQNAIIQSWNMIDQDYIQSLFNSIPSRLLECIDKKGNKISY